MKNARHTLHTQTVFLCWSRQVLPDFCCYSFLVEAFFPCASFIRAHREGRIRASDIVFLCYAFENNNDKKTYLKWRLTSLAVSDCETDRRKVFFSCRPWFYAACRVEEKAEAFSIFLAGEMPRGTRIQDGWEINKNLHWSTKVCIVWIQSEFHHGEERTHGYKNGITF